MWWGKIERLSAGEPFLRRAIKGRIDLSSMTRRLLVLGIAIVALAATAFTGAAGAGSPACANRVNNTFAKLTECVTLEGVRAHQAAFQAIADANGGIRIVRARPATTQTAAYVAEQDDSSRLQRRRQAFPFQTFIPLAPSVLRADRSDRRGPYENGILSR